jgi:hypothetical protein
MICLKSASWLLPPPYIRTLPAAALADRDLSQRPDLRPRHPVLEPCFFFASLYGLPSHVGDAMRPTARSGRIWSTT